MSQSHRKILAHLLDPKTEGRNKFKLTTICAIRSIPHPGVRQVVRGLLKTPELKHRCAGLVLSAIFHEGKATFLFSRSIMDALIRQSQAFGHADLSGKEYGKIWGYAVGSELLEVVMKGKGQQASVLKLKNPALLRDFDSMFGAEFRNEQKEKCLKFFNEFEQKADLTLPVKVPANSSTVGEDDGESGAESGNEADSNESDVRETNTLTSNTGENKKVSVGDVIRVPPKSLPKGELQLRSMELCGWMRLVLDAVTDGKVSLREYELRYLANHIKTLPKYCNGLKSQKQAKIWYDIRRKYNKQIQLHLPSAVYAPLPELPAPMCSSPPESSPRVESARVPRAVEEFKTYVLETKGVPDDAIVRLYDSRIGSDEVVWKAIGDYFRQGEREFTQKDAVRAVRESLNTASTEGAGQIEAETFSPLEDERREEQPVKRKLTARELLCKRVVK